MVTENREEVGSLPQLDAELRGRACTRGAGCFQSSLERRAGPQNTVFKPQRRALFPLVYFNSNFYVRNTTWNADTGEHESARRRTWHMIKKKEKKKNNLHCRNAAIFFNKHTLPKAERCGSSHYIIAHNTLTQPQARKRTCGCNQSRSHIS